MNFNPSRPRFSPAAEWGILCVALVLPSLATWLYFVVYSGQPAMQTVYAFTKTIQFTLPLLWVWGVCRQRPQFGLTNTRGLGPSLAFGLVVAVAAGALYSLYLKESSAFALMPKRLEEKVTGMGAFSPARFLLLGAFISIVHSLLEEYYWRWYVFGRLRLLMPVWGAILLSSVGFMAHHVIVVGAYVGWDHWPMALFLSFCVATGGAFWAWIYARTGSLLSPWLSHLLVDCALIAVGYDQLWGANR